LKLHHSFVNTLYRPVHIPTAHYLRDLRIIINLWVTRCCFTGGNYRMLINSVEKRCGWDSLTIVLLARKVSIVCGIHDSFLCLQQPSNGLYPEWNLSIPHLPTLFLKIDFCVILASMSESSKWSLPFRFPTKMCYVFIISHMYILSSFVWSYQYIRPCVKIIKLLST
jgi:hypothetical protein